MSPNPRPQTPPPTPRPTSSGQSPAYQRDGRDATIEYYNSPESLDGQWYLFMVDENDTFVAHGTNRSRPGTPAAEVLGPDGYPVGSVIAALATPDGAWMDYLHINPSSGATQSKRSWLVRHDGMLFGAGWYSDGPSPLSQPGAYTQAVVQRALQLYGALGLDAAIEYYNSPESIDGQWYVYVIDPNDRIVAHAANPALRGTRASEIRDANGYPSGRVIEALATAQGAWVDYSFANPATDSTQLKHGWVVSRDRMIFGSGWYEDGPSRIHEPGLYTQSFIKRAAQLHRALGREAAIDYYNNPDSADGEWYVFIHDADGTRVANPFVPERLGTNIRDNRDRCYGPRLRRGDARRRRERRVGQLRVRQSLAGLPLSAEAQLDGAQRRPAVRLGLVRPQLRSQDRRPRRIRAGAGARMRSSATRTTDATQRWPITTPLRRSTDRGTSSYSTRTA